MRRGIALLVTIAALIAAETAAAQSPTGLRPPGTTMRVVVVPIKVDGKRAPGAARLRVMVARASRWFARASNGRMRLEGAIAPTFVAGRLTRRLQSEDERAFFEVLDWAAARGVPVDGALPIYVGPGLRNPWHGAGSEHRSGGSVDLGVVMRSTQWRVTAAVVHELLHGLGLEHANAPACRRGVHVCRHGEFWRTSEYGDGFDIMGTGVERIGAYGMAVLGLAPVTDAPPGEAVSSIRPPGRDDPTLLRLRTANRDWYLESRERFTRAFPRRRFRLPRSVIASYAKPTYVIQNQARLPNSFRYPHSAARGCSGHCLARFLYRPGRRLTVPGAFSVRVLPGRPVRVRTRWLDRTPPVLTVAGAGVAVPFGGVPELVASVCAETRGAGVAAAEVAQNGAITRVAADGVPGLARPHGRGTVRVRLAPGVVSAAIRLVDAAANASPWVPIDLSRRAPSSRPAFSPALGPDERTAPRLTGRRTLTVSGRTDPRFASFGVVDLLVIGPVSGRQLVRIGPGGTYSAAWSPPLRGQYRVTLRVPVERQPDGVNLRYEEYDGFVRW